MDAGSLILRLIRILALIFAAAFSILFLIPPHAFGASGAESAKKASPKPTADEIAALVSNQFGPKLRVQTGSSPYYLLGDFNSDGFEDIAVMVQAEEGREALKPNGVHYLRTDPDSPGNGKEDDPVAGMGQNCSGIALAHGNAGGWRTAPSSGKYIFYECFSGFRVLPKGRRTSPSKSDSLQLDMESGGTQLIFWTGQTYRGKTLTVGD